MKSIIILTIMSLISCNTFFDITSEKSEFLKPTITNISINNEFIPMKIESHASTDIVFATTGKIRAEKKADNILEIQQSENLCIIYLKIYSENQSPYTREDASINIKIPESYNGNITINNYGYTAKTEILNFQNLDGLTYKAKNRSDLNLKNIIAKSLNLALDTVRVESENITFTKVDINGSTDTRISLQGQPGNINAFSRNYMPITLSYNTFTTEIINIVSYSGDAEITLPMTSGFYIEAFSTSGLVTLDSDFTKDNNLSDDKTNKKFGEINVSNKVRGYIKHNCYLNGLTLKSKK